VGVARVAEDQPPVQGVVAEAQGGGHEAQPTLYRALVYLAEHAGRAVAVHVRREDLLQPGGEVGYTFPMSPHIRNTHARHDPRTAGGKVVEVPAHVAVLWDGMKDAHQSRHGYGHRGLGVATPNLAARQLDGLSRFEGLIRCIASLHDGKDTTGSAVNRLTGEIRRI
jgi:hypothetical protein